MKTLKLVTISLAATLVPLCTVAQSYVMDITLKNGAKAQCEVEKISDITFDDNGSTTATQTISGVECIDLGLPSGMLWATCNFGAATPYDYGIYMAWGETNYKDNYDIFKGRWSGYSFEYMLDVKAIDEEGNLTPNWDIVTMCYGRRWRMPTKDEFQELIDYCTWTWIDSEDEDGPVGVYATGPNGNSIFLPAAGNYHGFRGELGTYWSATVSSVDSRAWVLFFGPTAQYCTKELRGLGIPIRAVASPVSEDM